MSEMATDSQTMQRRIAQFRDRWSTWSRESGLLALSEKLSPDDLRKHALFEEFDDAMLERISPDIAIGHWKEDVVLFEEGAYIDLAFFVVSGEVEVFLAGDVAAVGTGPIFDLGRTIVESVDKPETGVAEASVQPDTTLRADELKGFNPDITFLASMDFDLPRGSAARLGAGELFGEIGALSGWPQSATARTASESLLIQIRLPALRALKRKSKALRERLDSIYRERSLFRQLRQSPLFRGCQPMFLDALKEVVELISLEPGEVLLREGEAADALYLVRSGFLKLSQRFGEGEITTTYLSKGMTLGETELLIGGVEAWQTSATSVEYAELVRIPRPTFDDLVRTYPEIEEQLWGSAAARIKESGFSRRHASHSEFVQVALDNGLVQGNSVLATDLENCTRCDDCVRACAASHGGRPRFIREGERYQNLLLARSCYHCRDPVCLVGCPTGAIQRAGVGDVVAIDERICIGCSTCANNCPYDAIVMHDTGSVWPEDMVPTGLRGRDRQVASKCDLCVEAGHDPACVSNCPQGCAYRVSSLEEFESLIRTKD